MRLATLRVAYHEAGHIITAAELFGCEGIDKATIVPCPGKYAGCVFFQENLPRLFRGDFWDYLNRDTAIRLSGCLAIALKFGEDIVYTINAGDDLKVAQQNGEKMLLFKKYSMQVAVGTSFWECYKLFVLEPRTANFEKELRQILKEAQYKAFKILERERDLLDYLAYKLVEKKTLTGTEIEKLIKNYRDQYTFDSV